MGPPLSTGFTLFSSLFLAGIFIATIHPTRREEKARKETTLFSTEGSPHALWLYIYIKHIFLCRGILKTKCTATT